MSRFVSSDTVTPRSHKVGTSAGFHPEDYPTMTFPKELDDDSLYDTRLPSSTRKYHTEDTLPNPKPDGVIRATDHTQIRRASRMQSATTQRRPASPPQLPKKAASRQRPVWRHPTVIGGAVLVLLFGGYTGITAANNAAHNLSNQMTYGYPRTYQIDQNVGHGGISHFTIENLGGRIIIYEVLLGNLNKGHVYVGPRLTGNNADLTPVTLTFRDVNGDGLLDMILVVDGNETSVWLNNADGMFHSPGN